MAFKASSSHQSNLFEDLTDDEDQGPIMCLMAKNSKVTSPNSSDDELDEEDEIASLIKQYGKSVATRIMKLIMKLDDLDETLESQEELFRLESEKSKALEKNLTNERKENKRLVESLKAKDSILLEVEESFTSEKRKVNDLTKELSLVEDTHANLKRDDEKLQESLTSLQTITRHLKLKLILSWKAPLKLVSHQSHLVLQLVTVVHDALILIFKLVLLTMPKCMP
jgi:DNA repair exonuclease SbcCD ATPase subunit